MIDAKMEMKLGSVFFFGMLVLIVNNQSDYHET